MEIIYTNKLRRGSVGIKYWYKWECPLCGATARKYRSHVKCSRYMNEHRINLHPGIDKIDFIMHKALIKFKKFNLDITLITTPMCSKCEHIKKYLTIHNIEFTERTSYTAENYPTIFIRNKEIDFPELNQRVKEIEKEIYDPQKWSAYPNFVGPEKCY